MDVSRYHSSTFTMVRGNIILAWQWSGTSTMVQGNIILAWQWSGTSIHIYRWSGISHLHICNGPGQHHTSMAMVRDIHSHLQMAQDITPQHSQWSEACMPKFQDIHTCSKMVQGKIILIQQRSQDIQSTHTNGLR